MNSVDKLIKDMALRALAQRCQETPRPQTVRQPSINESSKQWQPREYSLLFCVHNKSYYEPCPACRRNKAECQLRFDIDVRRLNAKSYPLGE